VNGYEIRARRLARAIVDDMRWRGITTPPLYARTAREFQDLVCSGVYAVWLTTARVGEGCRRWQRRWAFPRWPRSYNHRRPHTSLDGLTPMAVLVNNPHGKHT
jgi:hypothetical protein